ncbi:MAG TPA: phage holin, LLH family [Ktedonobacteraceae bacterium]|nr:phage holin, LLH family [Ktedonobacteraceae bacterium]
MTLAQTIMQLITTIVFIGGIWIIFDRKRAQTLPEYQIPHLDVFATRAVRAVEQLYPRNPGKRDIAIGYVIDQYKEYKSPAPSRATIVMAIEAAVSLLPPTPDEPTGDT